MSKSLSAALLAALVVPCVAAHAAEEYPARPVKTIVTVLPGGGSDLLARMISTRLTETMGKPFIVEYRPGGDSAIGLAAIAKAPPDGYTLGLTTSGLSIHQALDVKPRPFHAIRDFAPVILLATTTTVLAARASMPPDTLEQFIAYGKKHPEGFTFASCSNGSSQHIAGEVFAQRTGIKLVHVPYKGCTEGIPQVLNGQIDVIVNTLANLSQYVKAGKLKAYATTGSRRSQYAPELPTMAEAGLPDSAMDNWFGVLAPAGTPAPIVNRLNAEINAALARPEMREKLVGLQYDVRGGSAQDFANHIRSEVERFSKLAIRLGDD